MQECIGVKACMKVNEPEFEDNDFFIGVINRKGGDELLVNLVIAHCESKIRHGNTSECNASSAIHANHLKKTLKKSSLLILI